LRYIDFLGPPLRIQWTWHDEEIPLNPNPNPKQRTMAPLLDKTLLDAPLLEAVKAAVAARRAKPEIGGLSEQAKRVKKFLDESGDHFYRDGHKHKVYELMSAFLGENIAAGNDGLAARMVYITDQDGAFGHDHKDVILFCGTAAIDKDGATVEQDELEEGELERSAREATDQQVEAFFRDFRVTDECRAALFELVKIATGQGESPEGE